MTLADWIDAAFNARFGFGLAVLAGLAFWGVSF